MVNPIGGYFELELPQSKKKFPHSDGMLLNSGRHSLEYILRSMKNVGRLWIPYFTCEVILQPIRLLHIPYSYYHINELFKIKEEVELNKDEYLLYTNYFGIMDEYCQLLAEKYGEHLIVDNAQALYAERIDGINTFYSPRKFVGVPDGGFAFPNNPIEIEMTRDCSYNRCTHLLKRHDLDPSEGYKDFRDNSLKIAETPMSKMSNLTKTLLSSVDFDAVKRQRLINFRHLHECLKDKNPLASAIEQRYECPLVYPFYTADISLRKKLIAEKIFVAQYWPNVLEWCGTTDTEYQMTEHILPLPIDQRYGLEEMNRIINNIIVLVR